MGVQHGRCGNIRHFTVMITLKSSRGLLRYGGGVAAVAKFRKMAERAVLAHRLCRRYRFIFYIALVLVSLQLILMISFYSSSQTSALTRWNFSQKALEKLRLRGRQPVDDDHRREVSNFRTCYFVVLPFCFHV